MWEHGHLGRRVALKFLGPGLAETEDFRERFVRESRLAASLHHPKIVTVYDAGEAEGQLYIAMQYVEGTDLATLLVEERALGTVWVVNGGDDTVGRYDSEGEALGEPAKVGRGPHDIAADAAGAWVTNGEDGTVSRLDADGRALGEPIRVGRDPAGILLSDGVVWVSNRGDNTVSRLDATTGELVGAPIGVGRSPTGLAAGDGAIWVANTADGTVVRLDPETGGRIGDPIPVGREPVAVTMDQYSAWIADAAGTVRQLALEGG